MGTTIDDILIRTEIRSQLRHVSAQPVHGLLLYGQVGVGLYTIGSALARDMTDHTTAVETIAPDEKGTIGISLIQGIYKSVKTKQTARKVILIDDADSMSIEAQNAFLKVLEEPPANHIFILTTHNKEKLLPTITSRVQDFIVRPVPHAQTDELITQSSVDSTKAAQIRFLSAGLPAETKRLLESDDYFVQKVALMSEARKYIEGSAYERLQIVSKIANDRSACEQFLGMIISLMEFSFTKQPSVGPIASMELLNYTLAAIRANGNIKLQLSHLSLSLK